MQTRKATAEFTAYTRHLEERRIPANAILHRFMMGPGHEGLAPHKTDVASFHYQGEIHFNVWHEFFGKTVQMNTGATSDSEMW